MTQNYWRKYIEDIDFIAEKVQYHNNCRKLYLAAAKRICEESATKQSDVHDKAFSVVRKHVDRVIAEVVLCLQNSCRSMLPFYLNI